MEKLKPRAMVTCPIVEEVGPGLKLKLNVVCHVMCLLQNALVPSFIHSFIQ